MLNNNTTVKLKEMKMSAMARSFDSQLSNTELSSLSFEERFGLLVDAEYTARKNNRSNGSYEARATRNQTRSGGYRVSYR